eukprot:TRINITY_DN4657_c0_g1_i2.p1 TRINITY_DN4657_c0_g1~~TRINITY_DN4657_c0_g1_i2.p1  ORF type:complete len:410 (+),score=66.81 TRINITY_DN4657_c0_g1_i2:122-1351(+)
MIIGRLFITINENVKKEILDQLMFQVEYKGQRKELGITEVFQFETNLKDQQSIGANINFSTKSIWHKLMNVYCVPKQTQDSIILKIPNYAVVRAHLNVDIQLAGSKASVPVVQTPKGTSFIKNSITSNTKTPLEESKREESKVKVNSFQVSIPKSGDEALDVNSSGVLSKQNTQVIDPMKENQANIEELTQKVNRLEAALTKLEPDLVLNDMASLKRTIQALEQNIPSIEAQVESLNKNDSIVEMERNLQKTIEQKAKENETILTFKVQSESQKRIAEKKEMSDEMRRLSEKVEQIELNLQEISRVPQEIRELEAKFNSLETRMVEGFEEINRKLNSLTLQNTNGTKVQHQSEVIEEEWFFANDDTRYHKQGCAQILSDAIPLVKEEALAMNLVPCGVCHKEINGINSY